MDPGPVDPEPRPSPGARGSRPGRFPQGFAWKTHRGALSPGSPRVSTVPLFYHSEANKPPNDHAHQNTPRPGRPGARGAALAQELRVGGRHARRRRTEGTAATQPAPPAPGRPPAARALTRGAPAVLPTTRRSRWGGRRRRGHVLAQQQLSKNAASSSAYLKRSRAASCQQGPGLTRFSTQQLWGNPPSPLLGERTRRRQGINAGCWVGRRRGPSARQSPHVPGPAPDEGSQADRADQGTTAPRATCPQGLRCLLLPGAAARCGHRAPHRATGARSARPFLSGAHQARMAGARDRDLPSHSPRCTHDLQIHKRLKIIHIFPEGKPHTSVFILLQKVHTNGAPLRASWGQLCSKDTAQQNLRRV